jgi:hypothetical protein
MRWKKKIYEKGTRRVKTAFLFFPKVLPPEFAPNLGSGVISNDLEGRWLEKASWVQSYVPHAFSCTSWKDRYWVDDRETE